MRPSRVRIRLFAAGGGADTAGSRRSVQDTEPKQTAERRTVIEDVFAQAPRIDIIHKTVPGKTPEWYALRVLGQILGGDLSSRLYQKLVKDLGLAVNISTGPEERRGVSLFWVSLLLRPGVDLQEVERLVYEEIDQLKKVPVADWEMDKVRINLRRHEVQARYSTRSRAIALGRYAAYYNQPHLINTVLDEFEQVTKADLKRVADVYLQAANRTVVTTVPKITPKEAP